MSVLAELVAYMKLLPSQAMKIDFYVDSGILSLLALLVQTQALSLLAVLVQRYKY